MGLFRKTLLASATVLAASALTGVAAQANPIYVAYSLDGGTTITQAGSSGADGTAAFNITVGGFKVQLSGTGSPTVAQGTLLSNTTTVSSNMAGRINLYVSETGNVGNAASFSTGFSNDSLSTNNVIETTYVTAGNSAFGGQTMIGQATVAPGQAMPVQTTAAPAGLGNLFTLTSVYSVVYDAGGGSTTSTLNVRTNFTSVPEPASLALLGAGLVGVGVVRRRPRAK